MSASQAFADTESPEPTEDFDLVVPVPSEPEPSRSAADVPGVWTRLHVSGFGIARATFNVDAERAKEIRRRIRESLNR